MNRGMHDNTDLINEFDFRVFRVFKFLKFASNLKRASIGFFLLCFSPMLALFRLKAASPRSGRLRRVQGGFAAFRKFRCSESSVYNS